MLLAIDSRQRQYHQKLPAASQWQEVLLKHAQERVPVLVLIVLVTSVQVVVAMVMAAVHAEPSRAAHSAPTREMVALAQLPMA
jgi:hypothetical protein